MSDNRGISCLGLCHPKYPMNELMRAFSTASVIRFGWLDHFFNSKNSNNAIRLMALNRPKFCRVHIINGPGMNNGRTQSHEITYKLSHDACVKLIQKQDKRFLQAFRQRVQVVARVVSNAPAGTLELAVSPWLEHRPMPAQVFKTLAAIIAEELPQAAIVDNPVSGGFLPGYLREFHGPQAPKGIDIADLDGIDWEATDVRAFGERFHNARCCYIWGERDNGQTHKTPWKPPQQRIEWPRAREMQVYRELVRPNAFAICSPVNPIDTKGLTIQPAKDGAKQGFTWKLGDAKNYAVCLLPGRVDADKVVIVKDGQVIDRARFRARYAEDGSNRQIWDFTKHTSEYPHNSVLVADGRRGWVLELPAFRID